MEQEIRSFNDLYQYRYKDNIIADEREVMIANLMMPALQNEEEAVGKITELLIDPSFAVVKNVLFQWGDRFRSLELMQDLMQELAELVQNIFFRGIPERVKKEELLKYLLGAVQKNTYKKLKKKYEKEAGNIFLEDTMQQDLHINPRVKKLKKTEAGDADSYEVERIRDIKEDMVAYCIRCLMDTKTEPHKAITYCYATLLPMIFKGTQNEGVLRKMDSMSGRQYYKKTSGYRWNSKDETFELTGEIARNSSVLMKWAVDAMWDMTVDFLQEEVQDAYNMEPIGNTEFVWGRTFQEKLLTDYDTDRKEKDIVVTSEFTELNMKNWPVRLETALYKQTREYFMKEEYYDSLASWYGA